MAPITTGRGYGRAYFDRWYRSAQHRVFTGAERARRAALAVAAAEYVLGRPIRSVLDIGAGEGHWRAPLRRLRPALRYVGVDPSPYAVARFGTRRGIRLGTLETLDTLRLRGPFDLVLAVGFLNRLSPDELEPALARVVPFIRGVALLELFAAEDPLTGDVRRYRLARASVYRRVMARLRLVPVGLHLYAPVGVAGDLAALEHWPSGARR